MLSKIKRAIRLLKANIDCTRNPDAYARSIGVHVGKSCRFVNLKPDAFGSEPFLVSIGDRVTITSGVRFVTHDGSCDLFRQEYPDLDYIAPISVGNNVFIGLDTIILAGVTIGDNVVIGAGSIVSKDIPSDCVAAGIPAKPLRPITDYKQKLLSGGINTRRLPFPQKEKILREMFPFNEQTRTFGRLNPPSPPQNT